MERSMFILEGDQDAALRLVSYSMTASGGASSEIKITIRVSDHLKAGAAMQALDRVYQGQHGYSVPPPPPRGD